MQYMPATNGKTIHHGNHRFGNRTDFPLYIQHVQARNAILTNVTSFAFHILVAAGTKSLIAFTGQYHRVNIHVLATHIHSHCHFGGSSRRKSIIISWSVDRYLGNMIPLFKFYFFKISDFFPVTFTHDSMIFMQAKIRIFMGWIVSNFS